MLYESFGKLSYRSYYKNGKESACYIVSLIEKHKKLDSVAICEWGCGPARLIRHLPEILKGRGNRFYGTDYNKETIAWCYQSFPDIRFILSP